MTFLVAIPILCWLRKILFAGDNLTKLQHTTVLPSSMDTGLLERRGWTSLHKAAACLGEVQLLEELKHQAGLVNQQTFHGETPLLLACQYNCMKVAGKAVNLLLQHGANVNISDKQNRTPLFYAAMKGNLDVVATLLNSGHADPDLGDNFQHNPMHEAAVGGHWEIVECLLQANASILGQNIDGVTPVYLAAKHGKSGCLRKILQVVVRKGQRSLIDLPTNCRGFTPLMGAARNGHVECVQILLEYAANPNLKTDDSSVIPGSITALHLAVYGDHAGCVKVLFDKMDLQHLLRSANSDITRYVCPLQLAVQKRSHESLKVLLSLHFPVDNVHRILADRERNLSVQANMLYAFLLPHLETSLSYAVNMEDMDSMKILLDYGASVNAVSFNLIQDSQVCHLFSFPPVLNAVCRETWEPFDLLIEHGCDISYRCNAMPYSNMCLVFTLQDYESTKKLLMCGSDPHLLYEKTGFLQIYSVSHMSIIDKHDGLRILELLLKFSAITGSVQRFFYAVYKSCLSLQLPHGEIPFKEKWKAILKQLRKPSSLQNLCRIKIRQSMISSHGYSSFRTAISLLCIPQILKEYLLYSEINEDREHV